MKIKCSDQTSHLCTSVHLTLPAISLLIMLVSLTFTSCDQLASDDTTSSEDTIELTPLIDSNTNWLLSCNSNTDCDQGEICSCGSCVIPCEEMRGCREDCHAMYKC